MLELLPRKNTKVVVTGNTITLTQTHNPDAQTEAWSAYLTDLLATAARGNAIWGGAALPVDYLPSGVYYTTLANTLLSFSSVVNSLKLSQEAPAATWAIAKAKDPKSFFHKLADWTVESELPLDEVATDGVHELDLLGMNLVTRDGLTYMEVRRSTLYARVPYFEVEAKSFSVADQSVISSTFLSMCSLGACWNREYLAIVVPYVLKRGAPP